MRVLIAAVCLFLSTQVLPAAEEKTPPLKPITNTDVIALADAGLGDDLIIAKIRDSKAAKFDLSTDGLVSLKKKKVSDPVIKAMMSWGKATEQPAMAPPPAGNPAPAPAADQQQSKTGAVKSRIKSAFHRETPEEERQQEAEERNRDAAAIGHDTSEPCIKNFKKEGSFVSGYKFTTFADIANVSRGKAFDILIAKVAAGGWQIASSSKDAGIISASQGVISTEAKTVPFNITIQPTDTGVRVTLIFQIGFGMVSSSTSVQKEFCDILGAVK